MPKLPATQLNAHPPLKAILFDLDDTLLVEVASADAAFLATCTLAQEKYGVDPEVFHERLRKEARTLWYASPERDIIERISISHWEALWARFEGDDAAMTRLRHWAKPYRQRAWELGLQAVGVEDSEFATHLALEFRRQRETRHVLFDGVIPLLEQFKGRKKLGLITNGLSCLQREKIAGSGLAEYFDTIVVAGDVGQAKPHPLAFESALDTLQVSPAEACMVGNSVTGDIAGAQALGIRAILIDRGDIHAPDDSIEPDGVIGHLEQLPILLASWQDAP
jgi:putative hydrolase of the HAD superfamily